MKLLLGVIGFVIAILVLSFFIPGGFSEMDSCSVCEWNYVHSELLDYNDPGFGHAGALDDIWYKANYGEKVDLGWYESYRLKYDINSVNSFYLINYSNVCPQEPNLKYLGTGYINNYIPWSYSGPAYSITTICINGTTTSFNNCGWNPFPFNHSNPVHVFREKHGAWWNQFKEASLYDATISFDKPEINNQSWTDYKNSYQNYLDNGGVNVGSEYR